MTGAAGERGSAMSTSLRTVAILAWLWVLIPLAYGLYQLIIKIPALFGS